MEFVRAHLDVVIKVTLAIYRSDSSSLMSYTHPSALGLFYSGWVISKKVVQNVEFSAKLYLSCLMLKNSLAKWSQLEFLNSVVFSCDKIVRRRLLTEYS